MTKINCRIKSKPHTHLQTMDKKMCKVKKIGMKLYKEWYSLSIHFHRIWGQKMTKLTKWKKGQKIKSRIISKPHAHLQTIGKTCAKFQKDQYKIVWGVALTRYPLSIHFHRIWGQEIAKWKKWQKLMQGLYPNHIHIFRPWRKHVQSFKKIGIKLHEEWRSQGIHCLFTEVKKWLSSQSRKIDKK